MSKVSGNTADSSTTESIRPEHQSAPMNPQNLRTIDIDTKWPNSVHQDDDYEKRVEWPTTEGISFKLITQVFGAMWQGKGLKLITEDAAQFQTETTLDMAPFEPKVLWEPGDRDRFWVIQPGICPFIRLCGSESHEWLLRININEPMWKTDIAGYVMPLESYPRTRYKLCLRKFAEYPQMLQDSTLHLRYNSVIWKKPALHLWKTPAMIKGMSLSVSLCFCLCFCLSLSLSHSLCLSTNAVQHTAKMHAVPGQLKYHQLVNSTQHNHWTTVLDGICKLYTSQIQSTQFSVRCNNEKLCAEIQGLSKEEGRSSRILKMVEMLDFAEAAAEKIKSKEKLLESIQVIKNLYHRACAANFAAASLHNEPWAQLTEEDWSAVVQFLIWWTIKDMDSSTNTGTAAHAGSRKRKSGSMNWNEESSPQYKKFRSNQ